MIKPEIALLWLYLPTPEHIIHVFGVCYTDRWFGRVDEEFIEDSSLMAKMLDLSAV